MKLKELLNEETLAILSEDSVDAIEQAFTTKLTLAVEAALSEQDEEYSQKLEKLLEAIDRDATIKLKRVVSTIDTANVRKLKMVVGRYNKVLTEDAKKFKKNLVGSMSSFIDAYIDDAIQAETLNEAVRNKTATNVLENLRDVLAVDSALMNESVKDALKDGKGRIDALANEVKKLKRQNAIVVEKAERAEAALILEQKTAGMSPARKKHMMKTLGDKSVEFINENFDYTKDLIVRNEKKKSQTLKEEAFKKRKIKSDRVVTENVEPETDESSNPYLDAMQKQFK